MDSYSDQSSEFDVLKEILIIEYQARHDEL